MVILSLFDYTGNWAEPYQDAGHDVIFWDIKHTPDFYQFFDDINNACADYFYEHIFDNYGTVDGILAAAPCTDFAGSGARWWKGKDAAGETEKSIELIYQTLRIIDLCEPVFWAIENPVGRLNSLVPELGKPWYFQPYWYGDPYTKKTGLWGKFNKPKPSNIVEPIEGSKMWKKYGGKSERTKEARSETPIGFARAFYEANKFENIQEECYTTGIQLELFY
jgi:hypothetical protein